MKTHTRRAAAVAGIAILVGAASSGAIAAQGQTEQQFTHDAVILISANSSDQHHRGDRTTDHHRTQRADWSERNGSTHSRNGKNGTAATAGVEAAAAVDARAGTEVVLKSLPSVESAGVESAGGDSDRVDSAGVDSAAESCS